MVRLRPVVAALAAACLVPLAPSTPSLAVTPSDEAAGPTVRAGSGTWTVVRRDATTSVVSWTSPTRLPLGADRPRIVAGSPTDVRVGETTLAGDGRTVSAVVSTTGPVRVSQLDVLLSGRALDAPAAQRLRELLGTDEYIPPLEVRDLVDLGVDPGEPGALPVVSSDYTLDPVKLPGMREPIEMVGHVVEPEPGSVVDERPLVLFQHGRHGVCYLPGNPDEGSDTWPCEAPLEEIPSHLGYDYVQQVLASQGFTTVSIRVNGINAQDWRLEDGGADARAEIIQRHLDHWVDIADEHQVDASQVVLVGHSRGGEGVNRASLQIPLSAPYEVVGQVLLAPTDFGVQTAPYVPTVTVLPYCDGDVSDLQGQRFTDVARDLAPDDTSLKSTVLMMGANHNFFNTEWTPGQAVAPAFDDWWGDPTGACGEETEARLDATEQQAAGAAYIAGAVRLFSGEGDFLPMYDGSAVTVASAGAAQVYTHAIGGGRDTRAPDRDTSLTLADGARSTFCLGVAMGEKTEQCGRRLMAYPSPHWTTPWDRYPTRRFLEVSWTATGQSAGMAFEDALDLDGRRLELRTLVDPTRPDPQLDVRLTDADGASTVVSPQSDGRLTALQRGKYVAKLVAQTLVVDTDAVAGVDLGRITAIDLVSTSERGRVWLADVSSAPDALAPVPAKRLPLVSFGRVQVTEGDGPGTAVASVPVTVAGTLTRPARLVVFLAGQEPGSVDRFRLDLAPGQQQATVDVRYRPDVRDDFPRLVTQVAGWASYGAMTDTYLGRAVIIDDDPTPAFTARVTPRVRAGERIQVTVSGAAAVDYGVFASVRFLPVRKGAPLRGSDLPRRWLRSQGVSGDYRQPLSELPLFLYAALDPGQRREVLEIPTLASAARGGPRVAVVRVKVRGTVVTQRVVVRPR